MEVTSYLLGKKAGGGGPTPTGTINITSNGTKDVTNYASANVNVQPDLETKSITITENTTTTITPTQGKDGLSSVEVTTNVSGGGGETPETLEPIQDLIDEHIEYLKNQKNNYTTILNTNVTLYSPASDYTNYIIQKTATGYRIFWFPKDIEVMAITKENGQTYNLIINMNENKIIYGYRTYTIYRSGTYNSVNNAITGIQSNATTYSSAPNTSFENDSVYIIPCTNNTIVNIDTKSVIQSQKISSNETIEVIS